MTEVLILGAGPAGCAAAIVLAKRGHNALLIDRCSDRSSAKLPETLFPATRETLRALKIDLNDRLRSEVSFLSREGACRLTLRMAETSDGCAYVDRNLLDSMLREKALGAGAHAIETHTIISVQRQDQKFVVTTSDGKVLSASFLIDASGKAQASSHLVGGVSSDDRPLDPRSNIFSHFETERGFDLEAPAIIRADDGFFYAVPIRAHRISLGWVTYSNLPPHDLETAFLRQIEATPAARRLVADSRRVLPVIAGKNTVTNVLRPAADGVFVTGDALGFRDPFFHDGVGFALASGRLAGESCADIIDGLTSPFEGETRYATDLMLAEAALRQSTDEAIERVRNLFSPLQILDPHLPCSILAALMGIVTESPGRTISILEARRGNSPVLEGAP